MSLPDEPEPPIDESEPVVDPELLWCFFFVVCFFVVVVVEDDDDGDADVSDDPVLPVIPEEPVEPLIPEPVLPLVSDEPLVPVPLLPVVSDDPVVPDPVLPLMPEEPVLPLIPEGEPLLSADVSRLFDVVVLSLVVAESLVPVPVPLPERTSEPVLLDPPMVPDPVAPLPVVEEPDPIVPDRVSLLVPLLPDCACAWVATTIIPAAARPRPQPVCLMCAPSLAWTSCAGFASGASQNVGVAGVQ